MDECFITLREGREDDHPFIYSTWRNSSYYGSLWSHTIDAKEFFKEKTKNIKRLLKNARVEIATIVDENMDTIIGYSVSNDTHLNFIYVKADFRGEGIGRMLYPTNILTVSKNTTKIGTIIAIKKGLVLADD